MYKLKCFAPVVAAVAALLAVVPALAAEVGPIPQWIWPTRVAHNGERAILGTKFRVRPGLRRAELRAMADDRAKVFVDHERIAEVSAYGRWTRLVVYQAADDARPDGQSSPTALTTLTTGEHQLLILAENERGPAGVCLELNLEYQDGRTESVTTDPLWNAAEVDGFMPSPAKAAALLQAHTSQLAISHGLVGVPPWHEPEGEDGDYYQWQDAIPRGAATGAEHVRVVPGFVVELVRTAQEGESSWISLVFDKRGRALIGREGRDNHHGILRLDLATNTMEVVEETLHEPRGMALVEANGQEYLIVHANNDRGMYRLTAAGDRFEPTPKLLKTTPGGVGHGRNNVAIGPNGSIFAIHGNDVQLPADFRPLDSPCRNYAVDRLLPCKFDRYLFDYQASLPAGHLVRTDLEGQSWKLLCCGLRNPYGVDFVDGEAFTFDADNEGDLGTPWYRPNRLMHLLSGADFGWRQGTGMRPAWYPDSAPAILEIGKASPTDVALGRPPAQREGDTTSRGFPPHYERALYLLDWSYGRIYAVTLVAHGAGYAARAELFAEGSPLNVTALEFGPDGDLYFTTGGRATQSGLYRIRYSPSTPVHRAGSPPPADSPSGARASIADIEEQNDDFLKQGAKLRDVRRRLESFHGRVDPAALDEAWRYLNSPDLWLRHAARIAVEHQLPVAGWQERALTEQRPLAAVTALMALVRAAPESDRATGDAILRRLNALELSKLPREDQLIGLRAYQLALIRHGRPDDSLVAEVRQKIESPYPLSTTPSNQLACELLVYLGSQEVVARTMRLLETAQVQEEKLLWLFLLRNVKDGWTLDQRRAYLQALAKAEAYPGGREMPVAQFAIAAEFRATLSSEEAGELASLLAGGAATDDAPLVPNRPLVRPWKLDDLVSALDGVGHGRDHARGKQVFREANCVRCHRFAGEGRPVGPDLMLVGRRMGRKDLLETILAPSKVIDEKYRSTTFVLESGHTITGRVVGGDDATLLVSTNPATPLLATSIRVADIESREYSTASPMPEGLLQSFTEEEILDLLAYLESDGRAESRHYQAKP